MDEQSRKCTLCTMSAVEDERHVLQECPAYRSVRIDPQFQPLFDVLEQKSIKDFLNVEDQHSIALCIIRVLKMHRDLRTQP